VKYLYPFVLFCLNLLSGCSSVPLTSLPSLSRIDFMTTDLNRIRVAVALPSSLSPSPRGVVMELKYRQGADPETVQQLKLQEVTEPQGQFGLPPAPAETPNLHVYTLPPEEAGRLDLIRQRAKARGGEKGSMSFGISVSEFCRVGPIPSGPLMMNLYLLTSETQSYTQLSSNLDIKTSAQMANALNKLEDCR